MTKFKHAFILSLLAASTAIAPPAAAATLVDTGVPDGQGIGNGWALSANQKLAGLFTLAGATTVTSVEGFMRGLGAVAGTVNISIFTGGVDPGSSGLLHSADFAIAPSQTAAWQGVFGQSWNLAAGQYWVLFASDVQANMVYSPPNPLSQNANLATGFSWAQRGSQFGIGVRITDDVSPQVPGAVPEPGTWAMMLIGFGVVGGALRARRRAVKVSHA